MMTTSSTAQIRKKLNIAFDDSALSAFCLDYFPEVYDKFSQGMGKDDKITFLLDYCRRQPAGFETFRENVRKEYAWKTAGDEISGFQGEELKPLIDALSVYIDSLVQIADTKDDVGDDITSIQEKGAQGKSFEMQNQTNQGSKWMVPLVYLLATIGIPVAGATFSEDITGLLTNHSLEAVGGALLYGTGVIAVGFFAKVWQRLESDLVDSVAFWVQGQVGDLFSSYRQRYVQHLFYRHRDFDVKGLSTQGIFTLMLEDVFVQLAVAPQAIHRVSADPFQVPAPLREGEHTIWEFLTSSQMATQNLAILGPPGSGKTTLLKHVSLIMSDKKKRAEVGAPDKLPILLFLRDHAAAINNDPNYPLAQAIHKSLMASKMPNPPPAEWFERFLTQGTALVMFDGLDEVADIRIRQQVARWVEQQTFAYGNNRFIVASRPFGYRSNPLAGMTVLELQPFTNVEVRQFIQRWYLANEIKSYQRDDIGVHIKAAEGGEDLIKRVRNTPSLSALAVNPLLLTMIATVHRFRSSLPERRVELYAEIADAFLGRRQQARGLELALTPAQKQNVLEPLAYHMMKHKLRKIELDKVLQVIKAPLELVSPGESGREFLQMIENSSGLLLERESGEYSFAHQTFQEYLAAQHILDLKLGEDLVGYVEDSWWHETIRLYCARADATQIIEACLSKPKPSVPALTLAIECANEALKIKPQVRKKLETILKEGVEDSEPERRQMVSEALLTLHLKQMIRVRDELYVADSLITHAEYQLFLDAMESKGIDIQPDHWSQDMFPAGQGEKAIVGVRPSDAVEFCKWLTERDRAGWRYRLPKEEEFEPLPSDMGYWLHSEGQYKLENQPNLPLSINILEERLRSDRTRALSIDLDGRRDRALERALELASVLNIDHALDYNNDLTGYLSGALNPNLSAALNLDQVLAQAAKLDQERNRVLALYLDNPLPETFDMALNHALVLDLAFVIDRALARLDNNEPTGNKTASFLRWYARFFAWLITEALLAVRWQQQKNRSYLVNLFERWREIEREQQVEQLAQEYFKLYIAFAILEERIDDKLEPFEGIRLVKERKE